LKSLSIGDIEVF